MTNSNSIKGAARPSAPVSKEFIVMMAALMSVVAISIDAMLPVLGIIGDALNVTHPNQAQLIISGIFAGMAIGQLICGPLSDALGRKIVLYVCLGIYIAGSVICLAAPNIEVMLVGRFIQGLGVAGPYISCMSIVRDSFSGRTMAKVMSVVMMIFIMVPVVAPALGQAIVLMTSWQYIFVLYILYAASIAIWVALRLKETLPPEKRVAVTLENLKKDFRIVLTNRQTMCYALCMGCMFGALIGDLNSAQQIFQVQYGVGEMFVVYFGLQALAFGGSSLLNSRWVEEYGMRYICVRALVAMVAISVLFLAVQMLTPATFWMFFFYGTIVLFLVGLLFGNLNALALEPMGDMAGLASAVIGAVSNVIALAAGTMIGQFYDGTILPLTIGFSVLGIAAIMLLKIADQEQG